MQVWDQQVLELQFFAEEPSMNKLATPAGSSRCGDWTYVSIPSWLGTRVTICNRDGPYQSITLTSNRNSCQIATAAAPHPAPWASHDPFLPGRTIGEGLHGVNLTLLFRDNPYS